MLLAEIKKANLYIVESPFQLLSAIEAKHFFATSKSILIIRYSSQATNTQLEEMKKLAHWDEIIEIRSLLNVNMSNIMLLGALKRLQGQSIFFDKIFIGEYRSRSMRLFFDILNPIECFLLDDGNITIEIQNKYLPFCLDYDYVSTTTKKMLKNIFYAVSRVYFHAPKNKRCDIDLFTCFELSAFDNKQKVIKHNFEYNKTMAIGKKILADTIYFFGGNISEEGIIDIKAEITLLRNIKDYFHIQQKTVIYIPHRRESVKKLEQIKLFFDDVLYFKYPAEMQFVLAREIPSGIASFCSTALFTVSRMYKFESVNAFMLPLDNIRQEYAQDIAAVYNEYAKTMEVISL